MSSDSLQFLNALRSVIATADGSSIDLNSYCSKALDNGKMIPSYGAAGSLKTACPSVLFAKSSTGSEFGFYTQLLESFDGSLTIYPTIAGYPITDPLGPFPPQFDSFMQDTEAHRKLFSAFGRGKWDHHLMPKGTILSHKLLTLARIDRYINELSATKSA